MAKKLRKLLSITLVFSLALSLLNLSVFADKSETHEHNQGGWTCEYTPGEPALICELEHDHGEDCFEASEGTWSCTAPMGQPELNLITGTSTETRNDATPPLALNTYFTVGALKYKVTGEDTVSLTGAVDRESVGPDLVIPAQVEGPDGVQYSVTEISNSQYLQLNQFIETVVIEAPVKELCNSLFSSCSNLSSVTLPDTLETVSVAAFSGCSALTSIELPEGLTTLDVSAFKNTGLEKLDIPASVTTVNFGAIQSCPALTTVTGGEGITTLGTGVFSENPELVSVELPNVVTIQDSCFYQCGSLAQVGWDWSRVTSVGMDAFYQCDSLTGELNLAQIQSLDDFSFAQSTFTSVILGDGLTVIPEYAFYNMPLKSVTISNSVTEIGKQAFSYLPQEVTITIGSDDGSRLRTIGEKAFTTWAGSPYQSIVFHTSKDALSISASAFANNEDAVQYTVPSVDASDDRIADEADALSLQEAIDAAADGDTITISKNLLLSRPVTVSDEKSITLTDGGGEYTITTSPDFSGPMFRVSAGAGLKLDGRITYLARAASKVVESAGSLTLTGGTLKGASINATNSGALDITGGTFLMEGGSVTRNLVDNQYSGTVRLGAGTSMTMTGGQITENRLNGTVLNATPGVLVCEGASFTLQDGGLISENDGFRGAGVLVFGGTSAGKYDAETCAEFVMEGGTISGNRATGDGPLNAGGGGVYIQNNAQFIMNGGVISGNETSGMGGGVATEDASTSAGGAKFTLNGGTISGNTAANGGGIYSYSYQTMELLQGTISGNTARNMGGGVYVSTQPYTIHLSDVLLTGNSASVMGGGIWVCPQGGITMHGNAAAIYENSTDGLSDAGDDIASLNKTPMYPALASLSQTTLSKKMLGGGIATWYRDGHIYDALHNGASMGAVQDGTDFDPADPGAPYGEILGATGAFALKAQVTEDAKKMAEEAASLTISGNRAAYGGGIASNGNVTVGSDDQTDSVEVTVKKLWAGNDGNYPGTATVSLVRTAPDGEAQVISTVTLSEACNWEYTFTQLDPNYTYSITEASIDGYQVSIVKDDESFTVTNTYSPKEPPEDPTPEEPTTPETDIPEDPTPTTDLPEEPEVPEVPDEPVPTTDIPEEEPPKGDVPNTGDASQLWWLLAALLSGLGLAVLTLSERKHRREEF